MTAPQSVSPVTAEALAKRLLHAITTAQNDDLSKPGTKKRGRQIDRAETMHDVVDFLLALQPATPTGEPTAYLHRCRDAVLEPSLSFEPAKNPQWTSEPLYLHPTAPTIDDVPSCGSENDYRRATPTATVGDAAVSERSSPAAVRASVDATPRPPATAAMGLSAGGDAVAGEAKERNKLLSKLANSLSEWQERPQYDIDTAAEIILGDLERAGFRSHAVAATPREPMAWLVEHRHKQQQDGWSAGGGSSIFYGQDLENYKAHVEKLRGLDFVETITVTPLYADVAQSVPVPAITDAMVQAGAKALNPLAFQEVEADHLCDVVGTRREARKEARTVIVAALSAISSTERK